MVVRHYIVGYWYDFPLSPVNWPAVEHVTWHLPALVEQTQRFFGQDDQYKSFEHNVSLDAENWVKNRFFIKIDTERGLRLRDSL